ncbi:MAG: hypothetical protein JJU28_19855 [Cyclobacteriaceae bacterium]|nr:hypothetical protein [Cyclobacteriaceae bacterium]
MKKGENWAIKEEGKAHWLRSESFTGENSMVKTDIAIDRARITGVENDKIKILSLD